MDGLRGGSRYVRDDDDAHRDHARDGLFRCENARVHVLLHCVRGAFLHEIPLFLDVSFDTTKSRLLFFCGESVRIQQVLVNLLYLNNMEANFSIKKLLILSSSKILHYKHILNFFFI